jgi:sec-independent protein translocase protein TatC
MIDDHQAYDPAKQPLLAHLLELRRRLIWSLAALLLGFAVCYYFAPQIYEFLVRPLAEVTAGEQRRLIYTGLTEAFITYIKLAFWAGAMLVFPVIATQVWLFVAPGLYANERRAFLPFLIATPIMFTLGAALAYYFVFPLAWHFFLSFETPGSTGGLPIQLEARVSEYLSLAMTIIFAFGLTFLMPVLLVLLVRVGVLRAQQLAEFRRFAIVINFVLAAILTPPDVISQFCLAIPLCLLYEASIIAAKLVEKARNGAGPAGNASI